MLSYRQKLKTAPQGAATPHGADHSRSRNQLQVHNTTAFRRKERVFYEEYLQNK